MTLLRSLVFVGLFYLWSALFAITISPLLLAPDRWMTRALAVWSRGVHLLLQICCGVRVEVRGRQFLPAGPALVAPKHQCMLDVFSQYSVLSDACFVMKQELSWIPFFGWYANKMRAIIVDRDAGASALKKMVTEAKARFAEGRQLVIFPEGTRGRPGVPGDYKPGIAALYRELDLPVHPVATNSGVHWPAHGFIRKPGLIVFEYLEPIPPGLKRAEFMRLLQERVDTASEALLPL